MAVGFRSLPEPRSLPDYSRPLLNLVDPVEPLRRLSPVNPVVQASNCRSSGLAREDRSRKHEIALNGDPAVWNYLGISRRVCHNGFDVLARLIESSLALVPPTIRSPARPLTREVNSTSWRGASKETHSFG